jgi:hypothetical protein
MRNVRQRKSSYVREEVFAMRFVRCRKGIGWVVTSENSSDFSISGVTNLRIINKFIGSKIVTNLKH